MNTILCSSIFVQRKQWHAIERWFRCKLRFRHDGSALSGNLLPMDVLQDFRWPLSGYRKILRGIPKLL